MTTSAEVSAPKASTLRQWAPALSMTLLGLLSYVDRSVLAILSPTILSSLHLSATQYGYAILVFSLCYMVANPTGVSGWIALACGSSRSPLLRSGRSPPGVMA